MKDSVRNMVRTPAVARTLQAFRRFLWWVEGRSVVGPLATGLSDRLLALVFPGITAADIHEIVDLLEARGIGCLVAGGWGVDALDRRATRYHHDVDLVIEDYDNDFARARAALEEAGFAEAEPPGGGIWMPDVFGMEDDHHRRVELLGVDWALVCEHFATHDGPDYADIRRRLRATGTLAGRAIPCVSIEGQKLFHSGYAPRGKDTFYIRRLDAVPAVNRDAPTVLLVPAPAVSGLLRRIIGVLSPVPPHITILFPARPLTGMDPATVERIREVCAAASPIPYRLVDLRRFSAEVSYLAPEDPRPFVTLTERLMEVLPDCAPYEGQFEEIVPHLTVSERRPVPIRFVAELVARQSLPIQATAVELWLMAPGSARSWLLAESFPLGL